MGTSNLQSHKAQDFDIEAFLAHENYNSISNQNDIAVIKLSRKVHFDKKFLRPACLWSEDLDDFSKAIATGFGSTEYGGPMSNDLAKTGLDILNNSVCVQAFEHRVAVASNQICAGREKSDTCQGGKK